MNSSQMSKDKIEKMKKIMESTTQGLSNSLEIDSNLRFRNKLGTTSVGFNGTDLYEALTHKNVIYDRENDRILALSDNHGVGEIDKDIQHTIIDSAEKFFKSVKKNVDNHRGEDKEYERISELLVTMEYVNAASIHLPQFKSLKKEVNTYLKKEFEKIPENRRGLLEREFLKFFSASKASIPRGVYKIGKYKISNESEKEIMRKDYIIELLKDGVVDFEFLANSGIIDELDFEEVEYFLKNNPMVSNDQYEIAACSTGEVKTREELLEKYLKTDKKFLISFATDEELAKFIVENKLSLQENARRLRSTEIPKFDKDLLVKLYSMKGIPKNASFVTYHKDENKAEMSKYILQNLTGEKLIALLTSDTVQYDNSLSSDDIIKMYGNLTVDDILKLQNSGFVKNKDIIKLINYKSVKSINPEEYNNIFSKVSNFYSLSKLEEIMKEYNGNLPEKFAVDFNNMLDEMTDEENKQYFEKMFSNLKEKESGKDELLVKLIKSNIKIRKNMDYKLDLNIVENMYLNEEIDFSDVIPMYNLGYVDIDCLKDMFTDEEIKSNYEVGNFGIEALTLLDDKEDYLKLQLKSKKIEASDVIKVYSQSKILEIESLKKILEDEDLSKTSIAEILPDDISKDKIEDLFMNYFISHDDISNLVSRNMITQKEADEYAKKLTTHKNFEEIFKEGNGVVKLIGESHGYIRRNGFSKTGKKNPRASQVKIDPFYKESLLDSLGFKQEDRLLLEGNNNSLDGYTICPNEELGIIVFINTDTTQNATYVMSMGQGMYWLKNIKRERKLQDMGIKPELELQATKGKLRETEHIKIRNDSAGWGKNMVDAMKSLSPELKDKMKNQNYHDQINEIIEDIKVDYEERKFEAR